MDRMDKKNVPRPPPRFFKPYSPQSKEFYSAMPSTEPLPPIFEPRQFPDYVKESVIFQRLYDELSAASDVSGDDDIFQRFYDELSAYHGRVSSKHIPGSQFGSPTQFSSVDLGEASAVDAPAPSGQVGITTGCSESDGSSKVPVSEVAALKIDEK